MQILRRITLALVLLAPLAACAANDPLLPEAAETETAPTPALIGSLGG